MNVHVFIGVIGSGKDYEAKKIKGAKKIAFADTLRDMVWDLVGWKPQTDKQYDLFKSVVFENTYAKEDVDLEELEDMGDIAFSGRELLQRFGTDVIRKYIGDDFWADKVQEKIIDAFKNGEKDIVITDARFPNELGMLSKLTDKITPINVNFTFCDFHSERYDAESNHDSEKLAQTFLELGFKDGDSLNDHIYWGRWRNLLDT